MTAHLPEPAEEPAPEPPPHFRQDGDLVCQAPGMTTVRVRGLTEEQFLAAYAWAWRSLAHFDPATLVAVSTGTIRPEQAQQAKTMLAARLIAGFPQPACGELVAAGPLRRELVEPAYLFVTDHLPAADGADVARALATILGTDEATAARLAHARAQMMER